MKARDIIPGWPKGRSTTAAFKSYGNNEAQMIIKEFPKDDVGRYDFVEIFGAMTIGELRRQLQNLPDAAVFVEGVNRQRFTVALKREH